MRASVVARTLMAVALAAAIGVGATTQAAGVAREPRATDADDAGRIGVRLVDMPADAVDDPRARSYIVDELAPGTTVERRVEVSSSSASPVSVAVYASGASIIDGGFVGAEGAQANELSSWTSLDMQTVDVAAGGATNVTVTIAVPEDAPPGEQYAVIWAQVTAPADGGVTVVNRVGIRMYVAVSGDNPLASAFTVDSMTASRTADGTAEVRVLVHNTGGRALDLSGSISMVKTTGTVSVGPYSAGVDPTLAPGESTDVVFVVTDVVDDGPWHATVDLASGVTTGTYEAEITFPTAAGAAPAVAAEASAIDANALIAWLVSGVVLLSLVLAAILVVMLRRRHRRARRAGAPRY